MVEALSYREAWLAVEPNPDHGFDLVAFAEGSFGLVVAAGCLSNTPRRPLTRFGRVFIGLFVGVHRIPGTTHRD